MAVYWLSYTKVERTGTENTLRRLSDLAAGAGQKAEEIVKETEQKEAAARETVEKIVADMDGDDLVDALVALIQQNGSGPP